MADMTAALEAGDYAAAYEALQAEPEVAASPVGAAASAFLLSLIERFDEADALVRASSLQGFEVIVRGERQRVARARVAENLGAFSAVAQTAAAPLYAAMATAFALQDEALAHRVKADLAPLTRAFAGQVTFIDATTRSFANITDCDDAIGQMFETYCGEGLLYFHSKLSAASSCSRATPSWTSSSPRRGSPSRAATFAPTSRPCTSAARAPSTRRACAMANSPCSTSSATLAAAAASATSAPTTR